MNREGTDLEERALRFSRSLEAARRSYASLFDLERGQAELIEAGDVEGAAEKIDLKKAVLVEIDSADRGLREESGAWAEVRDRAPDPLRERLQKQVEALQGLIRDLLLIQQSNEKKLVEFGEGVGKKLRDLQKERVAHREYQNRLARDAYRRSKFYDEKT